MRAGSGALTFGNPDSAGVPADFAKHTIVAPFNDVEAVKKIFAANKNEIAAIIVEPVPGNAGLYLPKPGYLEFLCEVTKTNGALLIFDEVMTGVRLGRGGAQEHFKISPDLTCLGKIIGGGLPVGATFGGRADIMDCLAPLGPVYQAGTLSGNPLAMAAGIAALEELNRKNNYALLRKTRRATRRRNARRGEVGENSSPVQFLWLDVLRLFHEGSGSQSGRRDEKRPRTFRKIFSRHVGRGDLFRAIAVRGGASFPRHTRRRTLSKQSGRR